ncbi:hypothetical protein TIFTF001_002839 [Ficus carica]|uniref:Uncharacterized protein n=1 Tax=Ficus carica TaxID=3494 RepID=A0AA87ZDH0_FICCA|nr:hypothetical protein TIFTF001_002839 [Ficus carica]
MMMSLNSSPKHPFKNGLEIQFNLEPAESHSQHSTLATTRPAERTILPRSALSARWPEKGSREFAFSPSALRYASVWAPPAFQPLIPPSPRGRAHLSLPQLIKPRQLLWERKN